MDLGKLFYPGNIAIVGASTKPGSVGNDLVKNLATGGYAGKIYPVNPKAEVLYDLKCYPNLTAIGESVDLTVVAVPAAFVPDVLNEAGELGVKAAIVISAGFKEAGNFDLENQIKDICTQHDIALVGPNCLGVINPEIKMNASFAGIMPGAGSVALISQSGALCTALIDYALEMGIGFSKFMSVGNKAVLDEALLFNYLNNDPKTKVIALYAEGLSKPHKLIELVSKMNRGGNPKPIIILKSGRTAVGASASASHTGALAGSDAAYDALFSQAGIIRAQSVSQLFNYAQAFMNNPLPAGKKVAIITNAGGPGVLATDEVISQGLELATLSEQTVQSLKEFLPAAANTHNPIDVLGDAKAESYQKSLEVIAADPAVNAILVILTPQSMTEVEATAQAIVSVKNSINKPVLAAFMGEKTVRPGVEILQKGGVSTCAYPEQIARSMAALAKFAEFSRSNEPEPFNYEDIDKEKVAKIFADAKAAGQTAFPEAEALPVMQAYGLPLLKTQVVHSHEEAKKAAPLLGENIALKIVSKDILHKSDVGGVMVNINASEAGEKYDEMMARVAERAPEAKLEGVLLMEMAPKGGVELIVGSSVDPSLGQMVMVGLGGIYVEVLKDVAFGLAPITKNDAYQMIDRIKSKKIFEGVRGSEPLDVEALVDCIGRLSQLVTDFPEIKEVDLNPIFIYPRGRGVRVLDSRIVIE